jgi:hypothetical protein
MKKYRIQVRNQFGGWIPYTTKHNEQDTYRVAKARANQTGKQHRIIDENDNLLDLIYP